MTGRHTRPITIREADAQVKYRRRLGQLREHLDGEVLLARWASLLRQARLDDCGSPQHGRFLAREQRKFEALRDAQELPAPTGDLKGNTE